MKLTNIEMKQLGNLKRKMGAGVLFAGLLHNSVLSTSESVIIGCCPKCRNVLIVTSEGEAWRLMRCSCGFVGDTGSVEDKKRYDP